MKNVGIHTINFFLSNYFVVSSNNSSCFENFVKDIFQDREWECQKLAFTHPIVVLKSGLGNNWMQKLDRMNYSTFEKQREVYKLAFKNRYGSFHVLRVKTNYRQLGKSLRICFSSKQQVREPP